MLRIHTSHRTEVLLDAFVRNLQAERREHGPFAPVRVVVPNGNVETYLRLGVAERLGIAANLETTFLRSLLRSLAETTVTGARVADAQIVEGHLLALLHDGRFLDRPDLAPVRAYLAAAGSDRDAMDRRRCQLAAVLSHLFDEYAGSRSELLATWRRGGQADGSPLETWQRALWLAIFGDGGRLEQQGAADGMRWLPLEQLWHETMTAALPGTVAAVHVFGLSYVAAAYHRMLGRLGGVAAVYVYTLSPGHHDGALASDARQLVHPAISMWGRPGRENLALLAQLPQARVEGDFPEGSPATLLGRVQADVVRGGLPDAPGLPLLDGSLRVLPCPSLRRELEVVAAEIWALLRKDATLRACDVAVVVPERQRDPYLAQLPAVFHESCDLPHNLSDAGAAARDRVAEAIGLLVDLPFSTFSRRALLPLLTHPCLRGRFSTATLADWRALPAELGIVRGADRNDFSPAYLQRDLYSWHQGLGRLALGAVSDAGTGETVAPFTFGDDDYLPGPPIELDEEAPLGFGLLARSLIADARFLGGDGGPSERPLGEWLELIGRLVGTYVALPDDDPGQSAVARFLAALGDLDPRGLDATPVRYRVAAELARRTLDDLPASRGHVLASGVTVTTLLPMRAIPFRAIFVLGLGEAAFPRAPGRHELDLRREPRQPGDVDPREQDLYMFLETLLSARDHIAFSYVSRDETTGDELPASAALLELRALLGQGYLGPQALARLFCDAPADRPPLRRYDDTDERRLVLPAAESERRARAWAAEPRQAGRARPVPASGEPGVADAAPAAVTVSLATLRRFLDDPLQGGARFALGMSEQDDDEGDAEHEPFDVSPLVRSALVRRAMTAAFAAAERRPDWAAVTTAYAREAAIAELGALAPTGRLRQASRATEEAILRAWHAALPDVVGDVATHAVRLIPEPPPGDTQYLRAPSFALELALPGGGQRTVNVTVVGQTGLWAHDGGARALRFSTRKALAPDELGKEDVAAFLDHVALTAAGIGASGFASVLFHVAKGSAGQRVRHFGRLRADEAEAYLRRLCTALLSGAPDRAGQPTALHPYLLPHEAVLASRRKGTPVREAIAGLVGDGERASFSSTQGPVPDVLRRYAVPDEATAQRMIDERFGWFFRLAGEGGA